MAMNKICALLLIMHSSISLATVFSFQEQQGIVVKLVSPDGQTPLFYTKGVNVMQDFKHGYMVTAEYFHKKGLYPVGIIVHNKSNEVVKICAASIGSQQCPVFIIEARCLEQIEHVFGGTALVGVGSIWTGIFSVPNSFRGQGEDFLFLLTASALCIAGGFATDWWWHCRDYQAKARLLTGCVLNEDIIIKPGQKIIKYVLLDKDKDGVDRAQVGVLNGLQFTVFNSDDTPCFTGTAQVSS
jgi:hypothetical protein